LPWKTGLAFVLQKGGQDQRNNIPVGMRLACSEDLSGSSLAAQARGAGGKDMMRVKTGASRMNDNQLLAHAENVVTSSTGKTELDDTTPTKTDLGTAVTALKNARTAEGTARDIYFAKVSDRKEKAKTVRRVLVAFAQSADALYSGDATSLQAIGLEVRGEPQPVGLLPAPENVRAFSGPMDGAIKVRWNARRGRTHYELECASSPDGPWRLCYSGADVQSMCTELTPGVEHWFRVRAFSAAGPSPWSNLVRRRAA
jgi:hypothetical protein